MVSRWPQGRGGAGGAHQATAARGWRSGKTQAVVLILLPRCAGKFGADGTGGMASISAVAVELWISCAFFNTAMPTACLVPVSASPVANWAIPVMSIMTPMKVYQS
jgi:hypothetical protein